MCRTEARPTVSFFRTSAVDAGARELVEGEQLCASLHGLVVASAVIDTQAVAETLEEAIEYRPARSAYGGQCPAGIIVVEVGGRERCGGRA